MKLDFFKREGRSESVPNENREGSMKHGEDITVVKDSPPAESGNKDDAMLEELGYKSELRREFSPFELFGVSFSIMSLAPSIASVLTDSIAAGGAGLSWGWFVPSAFIMCIGITMSEMASAMPTASGFYWWTYKFAPKRPAKLRSYLSFLCGYSNTLGLIASAGSINYGAAQQILSCAELMEHYEPSDGVIFAVFVGVTLLQSASLWLPNKVVSKLQTVTIFLNLVAVGIICIALPVGLKHNGIPLNSGSYVFGDTSNYTNYPYGMSFILAWMSCIWTVASHDACVYMAEEASNATTAVPFGILTSIGLSWALGFLVMCVLAACVDASPKGVMDLMNANLPFAKILERALNEKWAVGIMGLFSVIQVMMGMSALMASSRQVYAFSRDEALPLSRWLKMTTKNQLPIPALMFSTCISLLLGLLVLAGPTAANAIFSLNMASVYLAWCLPIFCYALSRQRLPNPGPFYLGHTLSKIVALMASAYGAFVIPGLSMLPADVPVKDAKDMNYTCVVCGAVWLGASLYWLFDARHWYNGPIMTGEDAHVAEMLEAAEWQGCEQSNEKSNKESQHIEFCGRPENTSEPYI